MTPSRLKYAPTHEWVRIEGDAAVVGITDFAQHAMGDVTYVEFPAVGATLAASSPCGVIESVKTASELYAPVAGRVAEINSALTNAPEAINRDPYGAGWIFTLRPFDAAQAEALLDARAYEALLP